MPFLILLTLVAAFLIVATLRLTIHDDPGHRRPPQSHVEDPRFRAPTAR